MRTKCTFKWSKRLLFLGTILFLFFIPTKLKSQNQQIVFVDNFKTENNNASTFGIIGNIGNFDKKQVETNVL